MTRHQGAEAGPLFDWRSGRSGMNSDRRDLGESQGNPGPESSGPGSVPDFRTGQAFNSGDSSCSSNEIAPVPVNSDRTSEFLNDSPRSGWSQFPPLRGHTSPDFSAPPPGSSAALTLRSQRTEPGGKRPGPPTLRSYQIDALAGIERELAQHRSTLLVLPTGCGKTVVFAEDARRDVAAGRRVLVLAHRTELLEQAAKKLLDVGVYASVDQGDRKGSQLADVIVGSVQTLRGVRLERYPVDFFAKIIVDEGHHAAAKSYGNVFERFPNAKILGVTATPDRGDGKALGKVYASVAFQYEMRKAIADGYLVPLRAKRILVEKLDLSEIRTHHGDFDQSELSKVLNDDANLLGVVRPLLEQAGDRKALVFGVDVAHARALAEVINAHKPGAAIALDGTAKPEERKAVLALFRRGAFQYLCNCALFTEGFDEPDISCVALARPTQSRALYTQMLGRGTRLVGATLAESIANGKADSLVLDFVGNSGRHRLVGPADVLAGRELTDDERAIAAKKLDGEQMELEGVLADTEREAQEQKSARRREMNSAALVLYRQREVDLFLGDQMPEFDRESPAAKRPATPEQLAEIEHYKLGKPPAGISEAEADAMLKAVKARRKAGLCTIPQARLLETKLHCDTKGMTFARAGELIGMVAGRNAWSHPSVVLSGQPEFKPWRKR